MVLLHYIYVSYFSVWFIVISAHGVLKYWSQPRGDITSSEHFLSLETLTKKHLVGKGCIYLTHYIDGLMDGKVGIQTTQTKPGTEETDQWWRELAAFSEDQSLVVPRTHVTKLVFLVILILVVKSWTITIFSFTFLQTKKNNIQEWVSHSPVSLSYLSRGSTENAPVGLGMRSST